MPVAPLPRRRPTKCGQSNTVTSDAKHQTGSEPSSALAGASLALGCMRLSTEPERDETLGVSVLHAAFDAGINLLDTAAAYCLDDRERGTTSG